MEQDVQQFILLDSLLTNWDGIRIRIGPLSPALQTELASLGARLAAARTPDELAPLILALLKLTRDTPANEYVRALVANANPGVGITQSREGGPAAFGPGVTQLVTPAEQVVFAQQPPDALVFNQSAQALGAAVGADTVPYPVPVFFATNRNPLAAARPEDSFGGELGKALHFGLANVTIPVDRHRMGKLETPHWWTPFPNKNPQQRFVVFDSIEPLNQSQFADRLIQSVPAGRSRDLLVFLHGYNVTFESAVRRVAQFSFDVDFPGVVALFSWPSLGRPWDYAADGTRAEASSAYLVQLLALLHAAPWDKVHLLAHSMGNRVLLSGLADPKCPPIPFKQTVFVAADVEVNLFEQKFGGISQHAELVTSYASKADRALSVSAWLHRAARIGFIDDEPFVADGLETIDASYVDTSLLGHSYYGDDRAVLTDLGFLLREGLPAARRGLRTVPGKKYWRFAK